MPVTKPARIREAGVRIRISKKKVILPNPKRKASPLKGITLTSLAIAVSIARISK